MTQSDDAREWRQVLADFDTGAEESITRWLAHIGDQAHGGIVPKVRELIWVATSTSVRSEVSLATHMRRALVEGASAQEVYQAMVLGAASGGIPALTLGLTVLDKTIPKGQ